jgi:hypothetical protein
VSDCELTETYSPAAIDMAPADESSDAGDEDIAWFGVGGGHADDQACSRDDAVVGAQDGGSEQADARDEMALRVLV